VHVIEEACSVAEFELATREQFGFPLRPSGRTPVQSSDAETL
jgi:hypothetical protein